MHTGPQAQWASVVSKLQTAWLGSFALQSLSLTQVSSAVWQS